MKTRITTRQFGELEFDDSIIYRFPNGMPGFEELRDFIIIDDKDTEPLKWLLSIEDTNVGFAILDANIVAPELYGELQNGERASCAMFVVVVLRKSPDPITANLKAPVVIDNRARTGRQVVLNTDKFSTDHKII